MEYILYCVLAYFLGVISRMVFSRNKCEHKYELSHVTTYSCRRTGNPIGKMEHYRCTKCLHVKDVRIGDF